MKKIKKSLLIVCLSLFVFTGFAQIPSGYYNTTDGVQGGEALKTAFFSIIKNPNIISYNALWTAFQSTDKRPDNGKVWDMYSDIPNQNPPYLYTFITNQCTNAGTEGQCYNREHSMPKSWYNSASPMYTDLFHLYPTDGYVNSRRSNNPYGEVGIYSWISQNGSKIGQNTYGGYTGTVFEPIDEYKGDFARTYFYMVTAYEDKVAGWTSPQLGGNTYPAFSVWSKDMLLKWHRNDPVSQKEINRNNMVYGLQDNRNPYIDYPDLAEYVWGTKLNEVFYVDRDHSTTDPLGIAVAYDATIITSNGFVANWEAVTNATEYELSVYTKTISGTTVAPDLFFSEYIEGSGYEKFLEIYNGTGVDIDDLSTYKVQLYSNGSTSPNNTLTLSGTLNNGDVYIIRHPSSTLYNNATIASSVANYNGDDAIALYKNNTQIDMLGVIGNSVVWGKDKTLVRKELISSPNITFTIEEWDAYAQNDVSHLGNHSMDGSGAITITHIFGSPFTVTPGGGVTMRAAQPNATETYNLTGLNGGTDYFYTVIAKNGTNPASASSNEIQVTTLVTAIDGVESIVKIYAANGQLFVNIDNAVGTIEVFNAYGQKVAEKAATEGLNVIAVQKGLMIVKVGNRTAKVLVK